MLPGDQIVLCGFAFQTEGSNFDTVLAAYSGTCGALTQLACNDDTCGLQSEVTFPVTVGNVYYVRVGGWISSVTGPRQGTFTVWIGCS